MSKDSGNVVRISGVAVESQAERLTNKSHQSYRFTGLLSSSILTTARSVTRVIASQACSVLQSQLQRGLCVGTQPSTSEHYMNLYISWTSDINLVPLNTENWTHRYVHLLISLCQTCRLRSVEWIVGNMLMQMVRAGIAQSVYSYGLDDRASSLGKGKIFLFLYRLWGPPSLFFHRHRGQFRRGVKLTTHLHHVQRSSMMELYLHSTLRLSGK
jgi:hypothetical protein